MYSLLIIIDKEEINFVLYKKADRILFFNCTGM